MRVPSTDETAMAIERANRALVEIKTRDELDAQEEAEHRVEQLADWQDRDTQIETDETSDIDAVDEPVEV